MQTSWTCGRRGRRRWSFSSSLGSGGRGGCRWGPQGCERPQQGLAAGADADPGALCPHPQKPLRRMQIFRLGEAQVGTYRCSERSESMNWGAVAIPHSGRVMYAYEHSHKEYFHSHFVFAATPEQLGLDQMYRPSEWPDPSDALELEPLGLSIATATSQLFAHLEQAARACRQGRDCKWEPLVLCAWRDPGREPPAEEGQPALRGALWDRSGRRSADCKQLYLEKGRVVTQVRRRREAWSERLIGSSIAASPSAVGRWALGWVSGSGAGG